MDTTHEGIEDFLLEAVKNYIMENDLLLPPIKAVTFEEAGLLNQGRGIVLKIQDGLFEEFRISVVEWLWSHDD